MLTPFRVAFQVRDIAAAREFYGTKMGLPEGRSDTMSRRAASCLVKCGYMMLESFARNAKPKLAVVDDINKFHQFAIARIEQSDQSELTIDDLFVEWDSALNRDEINKAIRKGIADVDAGRTRPLKEVNEKLKAKLKLGE